MAGLPKNGGTILMIAPTSQKTVKDIDHEWEELLIEAKELGLTINEIRDFLKQSTKN